MLFMRALNSQRICRGVALAALLVAAQARAIIAFDNTGLVGNQSDGPRVLGNIFVLESPINVTAVGAFASGGSLGDGVTIPVAIYSYDAGAGTWNQVTGTSDSFSGSSGSLSGTTTLVGRALMQDLNSPVTLSTLGGAYAVVAANYGVNGALYYSGPPPPTVNTGGGAFVAETLNSFYTSTSGTTLSGTYGAGSLAYNYWSANDYPFKYAYGAGTFDFTPVPEAATFGAAGVGLLGLVYIVRYARLRRIMKPS